MKVICMNYVKKISITLLLLHTSANQAMMPKVVECGKILALTTAASFAVNAIQEITTAYVCPELFAHLADEKEQFKNPSIYESVYDQTTKQPFKKGLSEAIKYTHYGTLFTLPLALVAQYGRKSYSAAELRSTIMLTIPIITLLSCMSAIHFYHGNLKGVEHYRKVGVFYRQPLPQEEELHARELSQQSSIEDHNSAEPQEKSIKDIDMKRVRLIHAFNKIHYTTFLSSSFIASLVALGLNVRHFWYD